MKVMKSIEPRNNDNNNNSNSCWNVRIIYFVPSSALCLQIKFSQPYEVGVTMIPTLQMKKQAQRGYKNCSGWGWDLNTDILGSSGWLSQ